MIHRQKETPDFVWPDNKGKRQCHMVPVDNPIDWTNWIGIHSERDFFFLLKIVLLFASVNSVDLYFSKLFFVMNRHHHYPTPFCVFFHVNWTFSWGKEIAAMSLFSEKVGGELTIWPVSTMGGVSGFVTRNKDKTLSVGNRWTRDHLLGSWQTMDRPIQAMSLQVRNSCDHFYRLCWRFLSKRVDDLSSIFLHQFFAEFTWNVIQRKHSRPHSHVRRKTSDKVSSPNGVWTESILSGQSIAFGSTQSHNKCIDNDKRQSTKCQVPASGHPSSSEVAYWRKDSFSATRLR